jgi:YHS domain-containing protein
VTGNFGGRVRFGPKRAKKPPAMAPHRLVFGVAFVASAALLGCENDTTPRAEPTRAPAPAVAVGAAAPAGVCGEDEPTAGHCGCGATCTGKCGDGCGSTATAKAGCGQTAEPQPAAAGCGCGGHDKAPPADGQVVENTSAKVGDRTLCPVMSSPFIVKPDSPKTEYQGKTYHFCCEGCVDQFKKNPASFI